MKLHKKINEICFLTVFTLGTMLTAWAVPPNVVNSPAPITPGQWHSNLGAAITYSENNNIPLLYVWGVQGCAQSEKLDDYLNNVTFQQWAAERKLVMAYVKAPDTTATDQKDFAKYGLNGTLTEYPMVAVYWDSRDSEPFNFSGRYSVASYSDGAAQLTSEIEFHIASYATPVPYLEWTENESIPANLRAYTDTPAGDGIPNLIKYAAGLPAMTPATTVQLMNIVENPGAGLFEITYYKAKSATGVTLDPIYAPSLSGPWSAVGVTIAKIGEDGDREIWKASVLLDDQGFLRLRATAQ
ncbi:MAG: hypothetical protein PHO37_07635 [Kiritimatiellae bacterium]|nr:hypothetical protein [Kiritimatiellia bacterium]